MALAVAVGLLALTAPTAEIAQVRSVTSTAYCLQGTMADGTQVRRRSVASNNHPLGTKIRLVGKAGPGGLRKWVVRDRIGYGTELDFWVPSCSHAISWGRRTRAYKLGWRKP